VSGLRHSGKRFFFKKRQKSSPSVALGEEKHSGKKFF
jgi:hypothetical protein